MIHIKKQRQGINKQNDTESLPEPYLQINDFLFHNHFPFQLLSFFLSYLPSLTYFLSLPKKFLSLTLS